MSDPTSLRRMARNSRTVASKEILDFFRDWRTLLAVILIPLLLFPVMFILLPMFITHQSGEMDERWLAVEVQIGEGDPYPDELLGTFNSSRIALEFAEIPHSANNDLSNTSAEMEKLAAHKTNAILRLDNIDGNKTGIWNYALLHDSTDELSSQAYFRLYESIIEWEEQLVELRLVSCGLDVNDTLNPVRWNGTNDGDVATIGEQTGFQLSLIIPFIIALWTSSSALQPSIDLTAGERERGTMESLLATPVGRMELLIGKWLAVATITATSVILQLLGLIIALGFLISGGGGAFGQPTLQPIALIALGGAMLAFAILVVALELSIAIRARSVREAGSILGPLVILVFVPALFAQFITLDGIADWWFCVPLVNTLLAMREALTDELDALHTLLWASTSVLYAVLALLHASKQFKREDLVESLS